MWKQSLGLIQFTIEHSTGDVDRGPSLVISDATDRELVRFDLTVRDPAYTLDPKDANERVALPAHSDPISWTITELAQRLAPLLERAGHALDDERPWTLEQLRVLLVEVEAQLRNPPVDFDGLCVDALHSRLSEKWNTFAEDVLPAWVAEMDFPLAEPIRLVIQRAADYGDAGYPVAIRATGLADAFAARMSERFDWEVEPTRVEILTDVVQGMYVSLEAFSDEGDGIAVQTPIYPPFLRAVQDTGRHLVENRLVTDESGRLSFDLAGLRRQVDDRTSVIMLCNPHNPSGRVYSRRELEQVAELALERELIVVSDEIHSDLLYSGNEHIPFASLGPEVAVRTVTLTSATKAFNLAGLRCAIAHFGSADLHERFRAAHPRDVRGSVGLLGIYATIAAWQHSQPWLDSVLRYLEANRDYLAAEIPRRFPRIRFHLPDATYLAWLDCSQYGLATRPAAHFLKRGRVALTDGRSFGEGYDDFARINFATSRAILDQVLDRMEVALRP